MIFTGAPRRSRLSTSSTIRRCARRSSAVASSDMTSSPELYSFVIAGSAPASPRSSGSIGRIAR